MKRIYGAFSLFISHSLCAVQIIGGNASEGILIRNGSTGNTISGNLIGTDITHQRNLGNGAAGVEIRDRSSFNVIGKDISGTGSANVIAFNHKGVVVGDDRRDESVSNTILSNSIFQNAPIGIDLANDGITPNHPINPTTGPNHFQNFPVLSNIRVTSNGLAFDWHLHSVPSTSFILQFFANEAFDSEGKFLVTQVVTTTNAQGDAAGTITIAGVPLNSAITATATNTATGDTSEFGSLMFGSAQTCEPVQCR